MRSFSERVSALIILCLLPGAFACREELPKPEHVLLITVDTLRADHLKCYGYPRETSPNIDALAERGTRFAKTFAQVSQTLPSFASIMTSLYPDKTGVLFNASVLGDRGRTLAEYFRERGFHTGAIIGNPILHRQSGLERGFLYFDDRMPVRVLNRDTFEKKASDATEDALAWLGKKEMRPFFLWVHYQDPHGPYSPPPSYQRSFIDDEYYRPGVRLEAGESNWDRGKIPAYQVLGHERDAAYYVAQYDGEIRYMDHSIGLLLKGIETLGLKGNTLIIFTSDHGESLGENNLYFMHGVSARAPEANVPLIFVYPPVFDPGSVVETPVEAVDIAPTILELFGMAPQGMEGKSLLHLLKKEAGKALYYTQSGSGGWERAFVFYPWKAVINYHDGKKYLFNLEDDPAEKKDLAGTNREALENLIKRIPARFLKKDSDEKSPQTDKKILDDLRGLGYLDE